MKLIPGKLYKPKEGLIGPKSSKYPSNREAIILFTQASQNPERPLHHYYLYATTEKPPILFVEMDELTELRLEYLGSRYYHNFPRAKPDMHIKINAGKFLHEDRFVWVLEDVLPVLEIVNK